MAGMPGSSSHIGAFETVVLPMMGVAGVCAVVGGVGYMIGYSQGVVKELHEQQWNCLKYEERSFVSIGNWLIRGSGEITVKNVCVKWEVNRG